MLSFWLPKIFDPKCTGYKKKTCRGLIKVNRLYKCVPSFSWGEGRWLQPKWIIHLSHACFMDGECNPSWEPSSEDVIFMMWLFASTQMCPLYRLDTSQLWAAQQQWSHATSHIHHFLWSLVVDEELINGKRVCYQICNIQSWNMSMSMSCPIKLPPSDFWACRWSLNAKPLFVCMFRVCFYIKYKYSVTLCILNVLTVTFTDPKLLNSDVY